MTLFDSYNDLPQQFFIVEAAAYSLLDIEAPDDEMLWEIARCSEEIPHLGNLRASLLFERLEEELLELDPSLDIQFWVSDLNTWFYVGNVHIADKESLEEVIETAKTKEKENGG